MCQSILDAADWLKAAGGLSQIGTMLVAATALSAWKHQAKAKKQTDFLDELTDAVHEYIQAMVAPVSMFKFIQIGIASHKGDYSKYGKNADAIAYIERRGKEDSAHLWERLNKANAVISRINSLVARGQVYDFRDYDSATASIRMLLWQSERLQSVAALIGSSSLNWDHPQVKSVFEKVLALDASDMESHLKEHDQTFIKFVESNYKQIYSGT